MCVVMSNLVITDTEWTLETVEEDIDKNSSRYGVNCDYYDNCKVSY